MNISDPTNKTNEELWLAATDVRNLPEVRHEAITLNACNWQAKDM